LPLSAIRNDLLAERVALTPAPTLRRVLALETAGVISRYAAFSIRSASASGCA
jgi:DNA-binding Lrp family transcriptional regulator